MKIVGVVGPAESGKTSLLVSLIQELNRRRLRCGVLKRAEEEIELDRQGKDSQRFLQAGAKVAAVQTEEKLFLIKREPFVASWLGLALEYFAEVDFVFIEGGKSLPDLKKILVAQDPEALRLVEAKESIIAVVSEKTLSASLPHFLPERYAELADFLLATVADIEPVVWLRVNGRLVPLNPFVENMFQEIVAAMLRPLKGLPASFDTVSLLLKK